MLFGFGLLYKLCSCFATTEGPQIIVCLEYQLMTSDYGVDPLSPSPFSRLSHSALSIAQKAYCRLSCIQPAIHSWLCIVTSSASAHWRHWGKSEYTQWRSQLGVGWRVRYLKVIVWQCHHGSDEWRYAMMMRMMIPLSTPSEVLSGGGGVT